MASVPNFGYNYPLIEDQYIFEQAKVNSLICFSQSDESFGQFYEDVLNPSWWTTMFQYYQNPSEGIFSVMIYPFSLFTANPDEKKQVKVYSQWTPHSCYVYTGVGQYRNFKLGEVTIKPKYNSILDYKPYTKIYLNLPFYGELELDNIEVMNKTLVVNYNVDLLNGSTTIYVDIKQEIPYTFLEHEYKGNRTIFTTTINLGQSIPMKASGNYAQTKESMRALGSAIMGITMMSAGVPSSSFVTSKVKLGATTTSNLPVPMGGGGSNDISVDAWETTTRKINHPGNRFALYSGMHGLKSSLTQASNLSQLSGRQVTNAQSGSGWFGSLNMYVRYERHNVIDNKIAKYNGKPLYESRKLGNLKGMTKVENVILDNCSLKEYEKEQLIKYLYDGVILGNGEQIDKVKVFSVSLSGTYTKYVNHKLQVSNVSLSGSYTRKPQVKVSNVSLSGTYTDKPKVQVSNVSLSGEYTIYYAHRLSVSNVVLSGEYSVKPKVQVSNVSLSGTYANLKLNVSNVKLSGEYTIKPKVKVSNVSLSGTYKEYPKVQVSNVSLSGTYANLKLNVSNVKLSGTYKESKSTYPVKGDLITIENMYFRVLDISGSIAKILGMFDIGTSSFISSGDSNVYEGSDLDTFLNINFYNLLPTTIQNAIQDSSITTSTYKDYIKSPFEDYTYKWQYNWKDNYMMKAQRTTTTSAITRKIYAVGLKDIYDYFGKDSITSNELNTLFFNTTVAYTRTIWLRSSDTYEEYAWIVTGEKATLETLNTNNILNVRGIANIDLSKVSYKIVE